MNTNRQEVNEAIKIPLRLSVKTLLSVLQHVVMQNKNKIIFITIPDAADNGWHLYRYMCEHLKGKQFVWLCIDPDSVRQRVLECAQNSGNTVTVESAKSVSGMRDFISAGFVFLTHGLPFFLPETRNAIVTNLWHGMPIKSIGLLNKNDPKKKSSFNYTLSTSKYYTKVMCGAFDIPPEKVIECGLPRNDALLSPDFGVKELLAWMLHFPLTKRIVFWLPTYRKPNSKSMPDDSYVDSFLNDWSESFVGRLNEISEVSNCLIIVKLHPLDSLNDRVFGGEFSSLRFLGSAQWERLGIDLYDALAISSGLVSDLSSVLIDYAITGNPIAATQLSYGKYSREMIEGTDRILDGCYIIKDEASFYKFIGLISEDNWFDVAFLREFNAQISIRQSACRHLLDFLQISSSQHSAGHIRGV